MPQESEFKKVKDAIGRYSGGLRPMVWSSIFAMSLHEGFFGINYGRGGDSKSFCTVELANRLGYHNPKMTDENGYGVSPVVVAPNNCTDRVFFDFLNGHSNKCVVVDDASKLTGQQISLLKEATGETGMVEYTTSRDSNRNRFKFTGSILMNINYEKQESAIISRAYINYFYFDHEDMVRRREGARKYTTKNIWEKDKDIWNLVKKKINKMIDNKIDKKNIPKLTEAEIKKAHKIVDSVDVDFYSTASMRDDNRAIRIVEMFKHMFGELTDDVWEEASMVATHYLTSGVKDKTECIVRIVKQYFKKYSVSSVKLFELIEMIRNRYPNENFRSMLDTAFATNRIIRGNNRTSVTLPNIEPKIQLSKN